MQTYRIELTSDFGEVWLAHGTYTGPTAREDARATARYIRNEMHRSSYVARLASGDRRVAGVRVVPA